MFFVGKDKDVLQLLAWCFAALFLIAQSQAGAHFHDESDDTGSAAECVLCAVGSQLDDTVETDLDPCVLSPGWALLAPRLENLAAQFSAADANARAPPVS